MVTFRRKIRLWPETSVTRRALMIHDDADTYWLACQMLQQPRSRAAERGHLDSGAERSDLDHGAAHGQYTTAS